MNTTHKRIAAAIMSLALGLSGGAYVAPMALAQGGPTAAIDPTADVSLTIEKRTGDPSSNATNPGDATGLPAGNAPLGGVNFTVQRVTITNPLNTATAWNEITSLDPLNIPAGNLGATWTEATDANGQIVLAEGGLADDGTTPFDQGVYLVTETQADGYTVAAPFLVTLPYTNNAGQWAYEQVVIPKNQAVSVTKEVVDVGKTVGDTIDYTIEASVPAGSLDRFIIRDPLPAALGEATNVVVTTYDSLAADPTATEQTVPGADFTLVTTGGTDLNDMTITFTPDGLTNLETARAGKPGLQVRVTFRAVITSIPASNEITNHVYVDLPNGGEIDTLAGGTSDQPGDGAQTRIGDLDINLVNQAGTALPATSDSTFELWRCVETAPGSGEYKITSGTQVRAQQGDTSTDEFTIATRDSSVALTGVQAWNWVNGAAATDFLCAIQTKAPEGYVLNPEPQRVDFVVPASGYDMTVDVANIPDTIAGNLPATGGKGALLIIAAGLLVAAVGGTVAARGNRARKSA